MSTVPAASLVPTPPRTSPGTSPPPRKAEDRETFLKLLVAQLKNQDPLTPQDGAQFVAQLAQFSSLDQLISINQQLAALQGSTTVTNTSQPPPALTKI